MNISFRPQFSATFVGNQTLVNQFPQLAKLANTLKNVPENRWRIVFY